MGEMVEGRDEGWEGMFLALGGRASRGGSVEFNKWREGGGEMRGFFGEARFCDYATQSPDE
jgi:hypothetical protein